MDTNSKDDSESTIVKNVYKKGYHVTEACVLTRNNHPVSFFSRIHSSFKKDFKSVNAITFQAMVQGAALFGTATFVMDRGYDDNKMFPKLDELCRTMWSDSNPTASFCTTISGQRPQNCVTDGRAKSKQAYFIKAKTAKLIFHMSRYRLPQPEKIFI